MKPPPGFEERDDAEPDAEPAAPTRTGQTGGFGSTSTFAPGTTDARLITGATAKVSLRPLPKRQLWIVKVPKPPEDHGAAEAANREPSTETRIAALEAEIAALDARVRASNRARDAARTHLAKAREREREVSASIKARTAECVNPARDRVNELNAMDRRVRDARRLVGFDSESAVDAELARLESRMNHETLSVPEQKRLLREMSKLRAKRPEAKALESSIRELENAKEERARLGAELKTARDALEPLREKREMSRKIVDHYARAANAAVEDSAEAYSAKTARVTEVKRLRKEGYEARRARRETAQSREREEWLLARRTFGEARDLVNRGEFAEAEAACLAQMEHVHARLNMDPEYRAKYLEGLRRDRAEREAAAKAAIEADAEATAKAAAAAADAALEAKRAAAAAAEASREKEEKERARAEKEELRRRAKEERAAADAALAEDVRRRAELASINEGRRIRPPPPPPPVLAPSKIAAALARAAGDTNEEAPPGRVGSGASPSPRDLTTVTTATTEKEDRRAKNAEKKRRRRERAVAEREAERSRLEANERRDEAKREERAMKRRGAGGAGGGGEGDGSGRPGARKPLATTKQSILPAGMRAMTSRHRARAPAASWPATVAAGASLVSLVAAVIVSLLWSPRGS